ncbi:MAG: thermonuclease family protein [bacterium]
MSLCALLLGWLTPSVPAWADFTGKVVGISDGDTITVLHQGVGERVRLSGIDCPEKRQPFGNRAKQLTSALAFGESVTIVGGSRDRYGRTIGEVILPDGRHLTHALVEAGMFWWYRQYAPADAVLAQLEREARAEKRGLWAEPHPIPPWEWRKKQVARAAAYTKQQ